MIILNIKLNNLPVFVFADRFKSPADFVFDLFRDKSSRLIITSGFSLFLIWGKLGKLVKHSTSYHSRHTQMLFLEAGCFPSQRLPATFCHAIAQADYQIVLWFGRAVETRSVPLFLSEAHTRNSRTFQFLLTSKN